MKTVMEYRGLRPQLARDVYLAPGVYVIGDVVVGETSSVWFGSVLRGDINRVVIGHHTNIQDLTVCHVADEWECRVGNYVTVGHRVVLHGCTVSDEVLVGMGAVLMNGVTVGAQSIIGAGALLTEGLHVPAGSLVYGAPARVVSQLPAVERAGIRHWADKYCAVAAHYRAGTTAPLD